jgi:hypothetical protein
MNSSPFSHPHGTTALAFAAVLAVPAFAAQQRPLERPILRPVPRAIPLAAQQANGIQSFKRTLPLSSGGVFSLANVNGSIDVEGWEREEVELVAVQRSSADAVGKPGVRIEVTAMPGIVAVRTVYPEGEGTDVSVEYRIRVPRRVHLTGVATVNGAVRVRGVEGEGQLRTVNGNVEMYDGAGRFEARSTNGNIYMELRSLGEAESPQAQPATIETVNGTVVLSLPAGLDSDLDIRTLNGDFFSELPLERTVSSGGREIRCRMGAGGSPLRIHTMNGAVRLLMARAIV